MNGLIIMFIFFCIILMSIACVWVFANLCWALYRIKLNGKLNREQYVDWFFNGTNYAK